MNAEQRFEIWMRFATAALPKFCNQGDEDGTRKFTEDDATEVAEIADLMLDIAKASMEMFAESEKHEQADIQAN